MNRITTINPVVWLFVTALTIILLALLAGFAQIQSLADAHAASAIPAGDLSIEARAAVLLVVLGAVAGVVVVAGLIATRILCLVYDIRARRSQQATLAWEQIAAELQVGNSPHYRLDSSNGNIIPLYSNLQVTPPTRPAANQRFFK
jgi:hypothetical protein